MSFYSSRTEEYYKKFIELQEKLRKSEEERIKLEMKFNEMVRVTREEEQMHYRKLRSQYKRFLEEDRCRQERNERLLRTLDRIENRVAMLMAKTERFKLLRHQYQTFLDRIYSEQEMKLSERNKKPEKPLKVDKENELVHSYIQNLSSQKLKDLLKKEEEMRAKMPFNEDLKAAGDAMKERERVYGFGDGSCGPNYASSIADDIMNSIFSRRHTKLIDSSKHPSSNELNNNNFSSDYFPPQRSYDKLEASQGSVRYEDHRNTFENKPSPIYQEKVASNYSESSDADNDSKSQERYSRENTSGLTKRDQLPDWQKSIIARRAADLLQDQKQFMTPVVDAKEAIPKNIDNTIIPDKEIRNADPFYQSEKLDSQKHEFLEPVYKSETLNQNYDVTLGKAPMKEQLPQMPDTPTVENDRVNAIQISGANTFLTQQTEKLINFAPAEKMDIQKEQLQDDYSKQESVNVQNLGGENKPISSNEKKFFEEKLVSEQSQQQEYLDREQLVVEDKFQGKNKEQHSIHQYNENGQPVAEYYEKSSQFSKQPDSSSEVVAEQPNESHGSETYTETADSEYNAINAQQYCDENSLPLQQYDESGQVVQQYNESQPLQQYREGGDESDQAVQQQYDESGQVAQQYDESGQVVQQEYDESGQVVQQYNGSGQVAQHYDESGQVVQQQYDESGQVVQQYNESGQVAQQYDESGQVVQQYDESQHQGQFMQQYDDYGQPMPQYDENGQPVQQYDQNGQPIPQYDQNGQFIGTYSNEGQMFGQYDEHGQLIQQYDETGQYLQHYDASQYDENGQTLSQYDEHGQLVQQYNENQQYDEHGQLIQQYDENGTPLQNNQQLYQPEEQQDDEKVDMEKTENVISSPENVKRTSNVMEMLDTDTESVKQNTKTSNDSDFDFSNG